MLIFSESQFLVILDLSYGYFMQKVLCYQSLPLPNIRGDTIYLPPIRKSSIPSWWGRFLVTDFFITFYIHTWRILAKSHGCIITTFEIMTAFQRAVLTKSWFYGQNTVQVANTWSSCKIWTNFYNFYCFHCLSNILHCFQTVECQ